MDSADTINKAGHEQTLTADHLKMASSLAHLFASHIQQTGWDALISGLASSNLIDYSQIPSTCERVHAELRKAYPSFSTHRINQKMTILRKEDFDGARERLAGGGLTVFFRNIGDAFSTASKSEFTWLAEAPTAAKWTPAVFTGPGRHLNFGAGAPDAHFLNVDFISSCKQALCSKDLTNLLAAYGTVAWAVALICSPAGLAWVNSTMPGYGAALDVGCAVWWFNPGATVAILAGLLNVILTNLQAALC